MAEEQVNGLTKADVEAILAAALKPVVDSVASLAVSNKSLTDNQKVLADTLAKLPPAGVGGKGDKSGKADAAGQTLSLEDVRKLLDERDAQRQQSAERTKFQTEKLGKLPEAYRRLLGNDPAKWDAEAAAIQKQFEADTKASPEGQPENKGGATNDGGQTAAQQPVDKSKIDPVNRIAMGVKA